MSDIKSGNWFARHKVLTVILGLVAASFIAMASSGTDTNTSTGGEQAKKEAKEFRFPDRADAQATDVEVLPGEAATIDELAMTVTSAKYTKSISEFETAKSGMTFLIVEVELANNSEETKPYNEFDFRIQTAGGQVLDPTIATTSKPLNPGDLVAGGKVSGQVVFEVPVEKAAQYVIWKPGLDPNRAIVQVKQ